MDSEGVIYLYFQKDKEVAETIEYENGKIFADYDAEGRIVGVEILGFLVRTR